MTRLVMFVCALLFVPALAFADPPPPTPDGWYKLGETEYNLGNFEKAADAFKEGFSRETVESKKPAYLFNVAQAYRQANRCKDAIFFYKRFISLKDQDTVKPLSPEKRAETQQRIAELEECAKNQDAIHAKPIEDTTHNPDGGGTGSGSVVGAGSGSGSGTRGGSGSGGDDSDDGGRITRGVDAGGPKLLTARFEGGAAKLSAGGLNMPIQTSFTLTAGYPLPVKVPNMALDAGAVLSITPVSYENTITGAKNTASMIETLVNFGDAYTVAPKISLRGDVGIGVLFFGGIQEMGSPFTKAGAGTSGTLTMFALRLAASVDYMLTPNLFATVTPVAFSYSPAKTGLREDIKALTRLDFMLGIGYRM